MRRVLLVEDEERVRGLFSRLLTARGYEVREAGDGHEAVEVAGLHPFDVLIMDVRLPKLDGLSALHEIRLMTPAIRTVLMTGYRVDDEMQRHVEGKVAGWLQKPVTHVAIAEAIDRLAPASPGNGAKAAN